MTRQPIGLHTIIIIIVGIAMARPGGAAPARAQEREHPSIHQRESELHHWDALKLDERVPAFARGKQMAIDGEWQKAIAEFQKGAKKNRAFGYYNMGLVHFYRRNYSTALRYFRQSEKIRRDSLTHEYLQTSKRLIEEHSKAGRRK